MTATSKPYGFGVLCQQSGVIDRFVGDDFALSETFCGRHFVDLLDVGSRVKSQAFLDAVRRSGMAFGWELDVNLQSAPRTMHFAGGTRGETFFICGVCSKDALSGYMLHIMNANAAIDAELHEAMRQQLESGNAAAVESDVFECLSSLNNELLSVQRELQKKNFQLKRVNDEKNRAIGVVAHDLRNPIAVIEMYATYLAQSLEGKVSAEDLDYLLTIKRTAASMSKLVNDVLDVAAIESGQLDLDISDVDVAHLMDEIVHRLTPLAREADVRLELGRQTGGDCRVAGDSAKLEQVFNNLIDNAIKFSPAGGDVEVHVSGSATHVLARVSDHGPGISQDALKTLFQPFAAGRAHSSRGNSGTGLGLSIARRIVEGHGGTIRVAEATPNGTTFSVELPRIH